MIRATIVAVTLALGGAASAGESPADSDARARAYFTDTVLVTHDGKDVRFYSDVLKDRVVVINFIFTRCESACPLLTAKLNRVRAALGERFGSEVQFVTISVDPEFDTPEALRHFAERNRAATVGWTFLTGTRANVDLVVKRLGQYAEEIEDHSTTFIAGNARKAHWTKLRPDLSPDAIVAHLERLAEPAGAVKSAAAHGG